MPFVSHRDRKCDRIIKLKHALEIGMANNSRTLQDKYDKFGPHQIMRDKVNLKFQAK